MLQSSLSKFASQFNTSSGGQGDSVPTQTVTSGHTTRVASNVASDHEDIPPGPEDQSEGIVDSEGDPADAGIPRLDSLKMTEEDTFSLASVTVPKRPWRAQEDSKPQPQNTFRQAHPVIPRAVAKAQSIKSAQSDQRSVQLQGSAQDQPVSQAQFPVLVPQGQGQVQGRPVVVRRDDLYNEEEFSIDLDNEAVLREKQARSEALDSVAEFCNLDRQDPESQKDVMGMRLPAYNAPAKKSIEISLPWHSSTIPIADRNHDIVRGKLSKSLKPQNPAKPWNPKDFFGDSGYYTHNTRGYLAKLESLVIPSRQNARRGISHSFTYPGTLKILVLELISHQGLLLLQPPRLIRRLCHARMQRQPVLHYPWPNTSRITPECQRVLELSCSFLNWI